MYIDRRNSFSSQPTPLSATHSVTQEDLKKDREAAAAKLREILTAEEDPPLPRLDSATSSSASLTTHVIGAI